MFTNIYDGFRWFFFYVIGWGFILPSCLIKVILRALKDESPRKNAERIAEPIQNIYSKRIDTLFYWLFPECKES